MDKEVVSINVALRPIEEEALRWSEHQIEKVVPMTGVAGAERHRGPVYRILDGWHGAAEDGQPTGLRRALCIRIEGQDHVLVAQKSVARCIGKRWWMVYEEEEGDYIVLVEPQEGRMKAVERRGSRPPAARRRAPGKVGSQLVFAVTLVSIEAVVVWVLVTALLSSD